MSLYDYFKSNDLISKVGVFELIQTGIKQGGNSNVLFFKQKNSSKEFAIKFLTEQSRSQKKLKRFIDEYFALIQLPPHKNVVKQYHIDNFEYVENEQEPILISYIIMKKYSSSLKDRKTLDFDGFKILDQIGRGLQHLHEFGVIHRDIKPENIFYDDDTHEYVLGDFGIAHFDEEFVARVSKTDKGERLANFSFSPEELMRSGSEITPASDIYSLGQVIQWWYLNSASKGAGRPSFGDIENQKDVALNKIVEKCIQSNIERRFQNLNELFDSLEILLKPKNRDIYLRCDDIDRLFRASFPRIKTIFETDKDYEIDRFVSNLNTMLYEDEFWYMNLTGGDNTFKGLKKIDGDLYLLNNTEEISIEKIIAFSHDSRLYNNFFIILTKPLQPFTLYDGNQNKVERNVTEDWSSDVACIYKNQYMDASLFDNAYIEIGTEVEAIGRNDYSYRERNLKPFAYIVCPQGAGPNFVMDRSVVTNMLTKVLTSKHLEKEVLTEYITKITPHHDPSFRRFD